MAIIYAYPEKATPAADDLLILSDSASTDPSNKTKTVKISSLPGATGDGITSLNGQTLATQSFANDTNVTITSAGGTHTLGWTGTLAIARGGTGSSSTTYCDLTANVTGILPIANGGTGVGVTAYCDLETNVHQRLPVANGGTGLGSLTDGGILLGSGAGNVTPMAVLADGAIVIGDGATDPVPYSAFSSSTGTLKVSAGGTGAASLTDGGVLVGSGTGAVTALGVLANGSILIGDGVTDPVAYAAFSNSTGTLKTTAGGTGFASYTTGDILYASGATTLSKLTAGTINHVLTSGGPGVAPAWAVNPLGTVTSLGLQAGSTGLTIATSTTNPITTTGTFTIGGTLAIANGGTGQTTAQAAIDALTQVSGATNEYILTKDTGTGNAVWKSNGADGENVFSPLPIYQGTTGIGTGAQSLLIQSVVDASFTCDTVKWLNLGAPAAKAVTIGIYTGDLTSGVGVRRIYGETSGGSTVTGVNTITFAHPYYFSAGDNIVIYLSMETPTIDPLGLTGALNNANTALGRAAYNNTPDASLATEIALGFASANGTDRVCMHFYQA